MLLGWYLVAESVIGFDNSVSWRTGDGVVAPGCYSEGECRECVAKPVEVRVCRWCGCPL